MNTNVGILGTGAFLPDAIRTNDWWPETTVQRWVKDGKRPHALDVSTLTAGSRLVLAEFENAKNDPFRGALQRRVLPSDMLPSDAEYEAASRALADANVRPSEIDLILTSSFVPDALNVPNAFTLQRRLGVSRRCFATGIDAACNAFPVQLAIAQNMISGGAARKALIVQSSVLSRLLPFDEPFSTYFGDGAAAAVVGTVPNGEGVLAMSHFANGADCGALVTGVPGKAWYDEGRSYWYHGDKQTTFNMLLAVPDIGREALDSALGAASVSRANVDFLACHQGTPWFRRVVQEHAGLQHARTLDTFAIAGSLIGANVGLIIDMASKEGLLRRGDLAAIFASGVGSSWSSVILRWSK